MRQPDYDRECGGCPDCLGEAIDAEPCPARRGHAYIAPTEPR